MDWLGLLNLVWQHIEEMENSVFEPAELLLKIDLVLHVSNVDGLSKYKKIISWSNYFNRSVFILSKLIEIYGERFDSIK